MANILQLEEFWLGRLHIDWRPPDAQGDETQAPILPTVIPSLYASPDNPDQFRLELHCRFAPSGAHAPGYRVEAEISGVFRLPPGVSEKDTHALVCINGGMILYGLLRGQVAMATGSFPGGKCTLPAVHLPGVFEAAAKKPRKRAPRRGASPN